jgi:hypothetical protein
LDTIGTGGAGTGAPGALEASSISSSFTLVADAAVVALSDGHSLVDWHESTGPQTPAPEDDGR